MAPFGNGGGDRTRTVLAQQQVSARLSVCCALRTFSHIFDCALRIPFISQEEKDLHSCSSLLCFIVETDAIMSLLCGTHFSTRSVQYLSDLESAVRSQLYSTLPPQVVSLKGTKKGTQELQSSLICRHRHVLLSRSYIPVYPQSKAKDPQCSSTREHNVLQSRSMEETFDLLSRRLLEKAGAVESSAKYLVGVGGPPGAGKSTVAKEVVARVNQIWNKERADLKEEVEEIAVAVPMDGFHLYRWQLDQMEYADLEVGLGGRIRLRLTQDEEVHTYADRKLLVLCRKVWYGISKMSNKEVASVTVAPWTFDPVGLANCLKTLQEKGSVSLPSFDHGVGDPVEDDIHVQERHKIIVVEGNYLLLNDGAWSDLGNLFDERWFIVVDIDEAMRRVERRHVVTGKPPDVAKWRVAYNDRPNAELIQQTKWNADLLILSLPLQVSGTI